ncbi:hypothetical protein [Acidovorax sp. BL-A-41-H1]|uniref:hypothetical protein n=1 Tax=Acidovorax sp. BL-A-41-H1 TaxID=3421102 RepID=UPI003F78F70D
MTDKDKIAHVSGELMAMQAFTAAILRTLTPNQRAQFSTAFQAQAEFARVHLMSESVPEAVLQGFESRCHSIGQECY